MDATAVAEAATLPRWASLGRSLGTVARSATGGCDGRVSVSGSSDASDGRRLDDRSERWHVPLREAAMNATAVAEAATLPTGVAWTIARSVGTFRYGRLR